MMLTLTKDENNLSSVFPALTGEEVLPKRLVRREVVLMSSVILKFASEQTDLGTAESSGSFQAMAERSRRPSE